MPQSLAVGVTGNEQFPHQTFYTDGRHLHDPNGNKVILRGVKISPDEIVAARALVRDYF